MGQPTEHDDDFEDDFEDDQTRDDDPEDFVPDYGFESDDDNFEHALDDILKND